VKQLASLALIFLAGCTTTQRDITPAFQGSWGGRHVGLMVGTLDADVQFDCAEGAIYGPYLVKMDGRFEWIGSYTRGTGGPARAEEEGPPPINAVYAGMINGPEMTMSVRLEDGQVLGPFRLERFKEPQLTRCL
jgi:hypothetical protein